MSEVPITGQPEPIDSPHTQPNLPPPGSQVKVHLPAAKPIATYTIIGITVVVYLAQLASTFLLGGDLPAYLGMKINELIRAGEIWRFITPVLLHDSASPLHIAFNMYALYVIGRGLEQYSGHLRFVLLYLVAGFAGNVFSFILSDNPSLGASTAVFGLVAAQGVFIYRNRHLFGRQARPMLMNILTIVAINLLIGMMPRVDNWGHAGGLLGGLAFAWLTGPLFQFQSHDGEYHLQDTREKMPLWAPTLLVLGGFALLAAARIAFF
jgi:rhomboid protease GluP